VFIHCGIFQNRFPQPPRPVIGGVPKSKAVRIFP